jgi:hypothetical protein
MHFNSNELCSGVQHLYNIIAYAYLTYMPRQNFVCD